MDALSGTNRTTRYPLTGDFLAGRLRQQLGDDDLDYIEQLVENVEEYGDGATLIERGQITHRSTILIEGFMFRTMVRDDKRFIVGLHVPGDFVDLHGFALKRLDHNLVAAGRVKAGCVSHETLRTVMRERPNIARAMWFATLLDAAIHRKWIQILEQLDAPRRIAHLYAELHHRFHLIDRQVTRVMRTPFTQLDLADMCGVSAIHANRAVGKLREAGIAEIRRGDLYTDDWDRLKQYADFVPDYLYGDSPLALTEEWE